MKPIKKKQKKKVEKLKLVTEINEHLIRSWDIFFPNQYTSTDKSYEDLENNLKECIGQIQDKLNEIIDRINEEKR